MYIRKLILLAFGLVFVGCAHLDDVKDFSKATKVLVSASACHS